MACLWHKGNLYCKQRPDNEDFVNHVTDLLFYLKSHGLLLAELRKVGGMIIRFVLLIRSLYIQARL